MDVEIEHPHVHHHAHGARHWADFAIPAAALLISLISIYVAWHHGQVMRALVQQNERLVQANSLPWLQISGSNRITNGLQDVSFEVINQGVGPGEVRSVQILVDGRAVSNLREVWDACCRDQDSRPDRNFHPAWPDDPPRRGGSLYSNASTGKLAAGGGRIEQGPPVRPD